MVASGPSFSFQETKCMYGTHFKAYDLIGKGICEDDLLYLHLCLLTCGVSYRERPSERDCTISYFLSYIVQTIIIRKMLQNGDILMSGRILAYEKSLTQDCHMRADFHEKINFHEKFISD